MSKTIALFAMALAILTSGHRAEAQKAGKVYRVGFLHLSTKKVPRIAGFRQGLREAGYVEGQNIKKGSRLLLTLYQLILNLSGQAAELSFNAAAKLRTGTDRQLEPHVMR